MIDYMVNYIVSLFLSQLLLIFIFLFAKEIFFKYFDE